jgi:hypothetical protein
MWIGFSAVFIGMAYAIIKFLSVFHVRRLRDELGALRHAAERQHQKLEVLQARLASQQSEQRTRKRKADELHSTTRQLHARLQAVLPQALQPQLARCCQLNPTPHSDELRLLVDLELVDQVAEALEPLTILLVALPEADDAQQTLAVARFVDRLITMDIHFHGPDSGSIACVLPDPEQALQLLRGLVQDLPGESSARLRAALQTGMQVTAEQSELKRMLAHSLQHSRQLLQRAPHGSALLNEAARQQLTDADIKPFDPAAQLHIVSWAEPDVVETMGAEGAP